MNKNKKRTLLCSILFAENYEQQQNFIQSLSHILSTALPFKGLAKEILNKQWQKIKVEKDKTGF